MMRWQGLQWVIFFCIMFVGAVSGAVNDKEEPMTQRVDTQITPPHVFARVAMLRDELEHLRFHMGKPKNHQPTLAVQNAALREVFFQGIALFKKANRLAFELTAENAPAPTLPHTEIQARHVLTMVDAALDRIRRLRQALGIVAQVVEQPADQAKTPTDVFRSIIQANRQLNILLTQNFSSSDVYQQVSRAIGYAFRLRAHVAPARMPEPPAFEAGKRPADVYRKLFECFQHLRDIAAISHIEMLDLKVREADVESAEPSDVYDLASLIVSELAYLHAQLKDARPPYKIYPPGLKFPAHVYQRAGLLETQLIELQAMVQRNPTWLQSKTAKR